MNFTVIDCEQKSPAWWKARLGRLTGSTAAAMLSTVKSGEAAGRRNLRARLMLERLTKRSHESGYQSSAMQQGTEREPDALLLYEALTGQIVERTGFLSHNVHMAGCSLDGHVGDFEGIVEAKSPEAAAHLDYVLTGVVPGVYQKQCLHDLWITGAKWCDWISYNPDFPDKLQSKLVRIVRDERAIEEYEQKALAFLREVDELVNRVSTLTDLGNTLRQAVTA